MLLPPQSTAINVARQATRSVRCSLRISTGQDHQVENSVSAKKCYGSYRLLYRLSRYMKKDFRPGRIHCKSLKCRLPLQAACAIWFAERSSKRSNLRLLRYENGMNSGTNLRRLGNPVSFYASCLLYEVYPMESDFL